MKAYDALLAKTPSEPPRPQETLLGHTVRVCRVADLLADKLAPCVANTLGCSTAVVDYWREAIRVSAWMHDWGKANADFQNLVRGQTATQGVRHEKITLAILVELQTWLQPVWGALPLWGKAAVVCAVAGHHLKFPDPWEERRSGLSTTVFLGHADFHSVLQFGAERFGLAPIPQLTNMVVSLRVRGDLNQRVAQLRRQLDADFGRQERTLIAFTKAGLLACDLAGSALTGDVKAAEQWLKERLDRSLTDIDLRAIVDSRLRGAKPRIFQQEVLQANSNTVLVEAGCGSGKTAAAYLWGSRNAHGMRMFFCYPTTATASEGFAGYLHDPDFDAVLIHSRAQADYHLLPNMPKPSHEENELRAAGLEALETWPIPAAVCTAHTVLGILENTRRGLYAWPSAIRSVFVFDEIHAFSNRLFSYLLRFLRDLPGARVLLMTATLPPARKSALESVCRESGRSLTVIHGPQQREAAARYVLEDTSRDAAWRQAGVILAAGGKVLWVCNTVARAMGTLDEALRRGLPAEPYHSRYRYRDRLVRQRTVIDGFRPSGPPMLAIATQVAEMSLDLSADLLITEHAPVAAMIQRLGRLNRFDDVPSETRTALLLAPESEVPYDKEAWQGVAEWVSHVCDGQPKSQRDLAEAFVATIGSDGEPPQPAPRCEWFDGLWDTAVRRGIEEAAFSVEIIREQDVGEGLHVENAIPMPFPRRLAWQDWSRVGRCLVAPAGTLQYDDFRGARWNEN